MLGRRQIDVQRGNLASMCRIAIKSLLDYACLYSHVDDDCEEFVNFCAVFEQMVSHRLRPHLKKVWLRGQGNPRHFWEVLLDSHHRSGSFLFQTCIPNIEAIENIKSPKAKMRAFIRVALMEKRLSDYMYWVLDNGTLIQESYLEGALLASEEAVVLVGDLIGLNAIDFNFCLKGNENDLLGPLEINYAPFLKYKQTSASRSSDEIEMLRLSGEETERLQPTRTDHSSGEFGLQKFQMLEKDFRGLKEQKDYVEELLRFRERQAMESKARIETMKRSMALKERDWENERKIFDACILELQGDISKVRSQNDLLRNQVQALKQFKDKFEMAEVPMVDMATGSSSQHETAMEMDRVGQRLIEPTPRTITVGTKHKSSSSISSDQRSIMSSISDQIKLKEDTQSMVPLTGSLADVNVAMLDSSSSIQTAVTTEDTGREVRMISHSEKNSKSESRSLDGCILESSENFSDESESLQVQDNGSRSLEREKLGAKIAEDFETNISIDKEERKQKDTTHKATVSWGMCESYVLTDGNDVGPTLTSSESVEVKGAETILQSPKGEEGNKNANSMPQAAAESSMNLPQDVINEEAVLTEACGDEGVNSEDSDDPAHKEEEVLTSDPEILEHINSSSDGSDAAWEMVSENEQEDTTTTSEQ